MIPSALDTPSKKGGSQKWLYTQNGKAKAQNNITKAAKINTVCKLCMNKVASLLIGRKLLSNNK